MRHVLARSGVVSKSALYSSVFTSLGFAGVPVAQALEIVPSIEAQTTISDNVDIGFSTERQSGAIFTLAPALSFKDRGSSLRIDGSVGLKAIYFSGGSQKNQLLPRVDLTLSADIVRNFFTVEAGVRSERYSVNPLGLQLEGDTTEDRFTSLSYRLNPKIEKELSPGLKVFANSENTLTQTEGAAQSVSGWVSSNSLAYVEQKPAPLGWRVELANESTRFRQASGNSYRNTAGKGSLSYSPSTEFVLSLSAGRERARTAAGNASGSTYGAEVSWSPSERTSIQAGGERRFFGNAWNFNLSHRMPWLAVSARLTQDITPFPLVFSTLAATDNVAGMLDGILTTRISDSQERAKAVQNLMNRFGIPSSTLGNISLYSDNFLLARGAVVRMVLLGNRSSLSLTASRNKSTEIPGLSTALSVPSLLSGSRNQQVSVGANYRLNEVTALVGTVAESKTTTESGAAQARQSSVEITLNRILTPNTSALVGARNQKFNLTGNSPARESAIFAGLSHRF
jgi:uncharacterized protein (PEP-CTERM system associated)